jgi:hypothetical protein
LNNNSASFNCRRKDTPTNHEHEKELHAKIQGLQKNHIQQYESQQAEGTA